MRIFFKLCGLLIVTALLFDRGAYAQTSALLSDTVIEAIASDPSAFIDSDLDDESETMEVQLLGCALSGIAMKLTGKHAEASSTFERALLRVPKNRPELRTWFLKLKNRTLEYGLATFYGDEFAGRPVAADGHVDETFDPEAMTAAHRSYLSGTRVRVTHLATGKVVDVTINDEGPNDRNDDGSINRTRIIDLSKGAARKLGITGEAQSQEKVAVSIQVLDPVSSKPLITFQRVDGGEGTLVVRWFIQVGSYSNKPSLTETNFGLAETLVARLKAAGILNAQVMTTEAYFRVMVGPYTEKNIADSELAKLKEQYSEIPNDAFVKKHQIIE